MRLRNKFLFFIVIFLFLVVSSVFAVNCEDNIQPLTQCLVVTPSLSCSNYVYNVYDNNVSLFQSGNLSLYSSDSLGSTYSFNFSAPKSDYLVVLCDGSTRMFYVNYYNLSIFGQSFNWLAIILIIGGISFVCLWISKMIRKDNLFLLKELLFFFGLLNSFVFVVLTLFISSGLSITNFNSYFNLYVMIVVVLLVFIIAYYTFITFKDLILEGFGKR